MPVSRQNAISDSYCAFILLLFDTDLLLHLAKKSAVSPVKRLVSSLVNFRDLVLKTIANELTAFLLLYLQLLFCKKRLIFGGHKPSRSRPAFIE